MDLESLGINDLAKKCVDDHQVAMAKHAEPVALLEIQVRQKTLHTKLFGLAVTFSLSLIVTEQTKSGPLTGSTLNRKEL